MANSNLPFNYRPGTAPSSRLAAPTPHRARRHATFHRGLLVFALILPAAAWASSPDPEHAPDGTAADPSPRTEGLTADAHTAVAMAGMERIQPPIDAAGVPPEPLVSDAGPASRTIRTTGVRSAQRRAPSSRPDFLFNRPRASIGIRGLWHRARADSTFHEYVYSDLFVRRDPEDDPKDPNAGKMSFDAPGIGFDIGFGVTSRLDVRFGLDYARTFSRAELRGSLERIVLDDGSVAEVPIEQDTQLTQLDLRGDVVFALTPRGRAIGQYVWIPSRVVPYVGAGLGLVRYDLLQVGDFVAGSSIFYDNLTSKGWGGSVHLFGGIEIGLTQRTFLTTEARYELAGAELKEPFAFSEPLDLSGLRISAGVRFVF